MTITVRVNLKQNQKTIFIDKNRKIMISPSVIFLSIFPELRFLPLYRRRRWITFVELEYTLIILDYLRHHSAYSLANLCVLFRLEQLNLIQVKIGPGQGFINHSSVIDNISVCVSLAPYQ